MSKASSGRVLIVDDEANLRRVLARELTAVGYQVAEAGDGEAALATLDEDEFGVVLLDLRMPGRDGLDVLTELKQRWPLVEVIMLTGHGSVDTAIAAMRAGAYDYQQKPCHLDELEVLIGKAFQKRALEVRSLALAGGSGPGAIEWGSSEAMARVRHDVEKIAATDVPVLILGESGTGKELVAREIHARSHLADQPFVTVNCGAISPSLVESALFGHERGAFTGADRRRPGLVEAADGGTLFLDELGDLPLDMQVKLLRFLQFGEVQRVGATRASQVSVRVLAATNADIDTAVERGEFRSDLLYRLDTIRLELPPLRERQGDVPILVRRFMAELSSKGRPPRIFSAEALAELERHSWPGNVRELRAVIERLVLLADADVITDADVRSRLGRVDLPVAAGGDLPLMPIRDAERHLICLALHRFGGDKPQAASALGIALKTLYNKIKAYDIDVAQAIAGQAG